MKRSLLVALLAALGGSSLAGAAPAPTVKTAKIDTLGSVLVSSTGRTLYHYVGESGLHVRCTGACAKLWPPLVVARGAKPIAGAGIAAARLGVVERPDGTLQVTYGGLALYRYAGDSRSGIAKGEALEHEWYAVSPAARIVKPSPSTTTATPSPPPTDTTGSSGGGYDY